MVAGVVTSPHLSNDQSHIGHTSPQLLKLYPCNPSNFRASVPVLQWVSVVSSMLWLWANRLCSSPLTSLELSALPWLKRSAVAKDRRTQKEKSGSETRKQNKTKQKYESPFMQPCHTVYSIPTCWVKCGPLLGRCPVRSVLELGHSTEHIAQLRPHKEATTVSTRPWTL